MRTWGICCTLAFCLCTSSCAIFEPGEEHPAEAGQILSRAGVRGGLVVHVGCGDGTLTAALHPHEGYRVHGLDPSPDNVEKARRTIEAKGLYGPVSADLIAGGKLPYIDNLVNLIVSENLGAVSMNEVMRALCPNGVAYIREGTKWVKTLKPRPQNIDEWTHYWHDPSGNPVAHDSVVGPPRQMQWVGSPRWSRHHDHMASMSAMVSAGGRVFYIFDEGPTASVLLPPKWVLIARDAFNGTVLWKRPIAEWNTHLWPLKSGPAQLPRRLVAVGNRVFVTLGINAPVSVLDAATGETVATYEGTEGTEEILVSGDILVALAAKSANKWTSYRPKFTYVWDNRDLANDDWAWDEAERSLAAVNTENGKLIWKKDARVAPLTPALGGERLFYHDGEKLVCLDRKDGAEIWRSEPVGRKARINTGYAPRLVVYEDTVLFSGGLGSMAVFAADTGRALWTDKQAASGHWSPEDMIVLDNLVWSGATAGGGDSGIFTGRDLHTGEVKKEFPPDLETYWFHHRCYPSKATDRFLLPSRTGIEFVDFRAEHWTTHHWVRGGCLYGILPANGLVYAPAHSCACYTESKLYGFCALAPSSGARQPEAGESRLEKGPAYGAKLEVVSGDPQDWPTYRHDPLRSGFSTAQVPAQPEQKWRRNLGGKLSSLVVAQGKAYVASIDSHTVHCLDADSGEPLWRYTTGARVDSPPTVQGGLVLFGSADGWVYCLRATDGVLVWRFRAAPSDLLLVAFEQLESVWPVSGSVLIQDGVAYCVAGRSMFLDGGLRLLRLDPESGRMLSETVLDDRDPETGEDLQGKVKNLNMPVALPDVLSCDGKSIYMRSQRFDLEGNRQEIGPLNVTEQEGDGTHLFSLTGFLDDSWFHRTYWMWGRSTSAGWGGWFNAARYVPSGRCLVFNEDEIYGFGLKPEYVAQSSVLEYMLYSAGKKTRNAAIQQLRKADEAINQAGGKRNASAADWKLRQGFPLSALSAVKYNWRQDRLPLLAQAMVLADRTLFLAGPPDLVNDEELFFQPDNPEILRKAREQAAALNGSKGSLLLSVSAVNGKRLSELKLDSMPVHDGMAASGGRLYLAMHDGSVICLGK